MGQPILLLGCPAQVETAVRHSSLGAQHTIQAVRDLRQPEVVSAVREAALVLLHEQAAPRDLSLICEHLRRQTSRPLIVSLLSQDEETIVSVLRAGADDCLPQTQSGAELVARLRAHLRRDREYATTIQPEPLQRGDLCVDPVRHEVQVAGQLVDLTPREFSLLECLAQTAGRVVPRSELLQRVWGYSNAMTTRTLDVHVGRLRQKIEQDPRVPRRLLTIPGVGYKLAT